MKLALWWRGDCDERGHLTLSSSELIDLLEWMDDDGAFKTALRGGRWPDWKRMAAESVNEQYRMRAWYLAFKSDDNNDFTFDPSDYEFVDPADQEIIAEQKAKEASMIAGFNAELGYS